MPRCFQRLGIVSSNNDYNIYIVNKGYTKHMILSIFRSIKYLTLKCVTSVISVTKYA